MDDEYSPNNIDSLLFKFALQTRELSQKKDEINKQIKVCRADIAERRTYIETIHRNIEKLEEDIRVKQITLSHNKANAKSMKTTNSLLLQYEQTLRAELESRKASYNHDMEVYKDRITSYGKTFQSHKEYYCENALAQKLFGLQAEKEEIECRIKACDAQITVKQKELDHLTGTEVGSFSTEKLPDSVSGQQPLTDPENQTDETSDFAIGISSLHLNQTENCQKVSVEAKAADIVEEHMVQDTTASSPHPGNTCSPHLEKACSDLWSHECENEHSCPDEQEMETELHNQSLSTVSEEENAVEDRVEDRASADEDQAPSKKANEGLPAFPHSSSQEANRQPSMAKMTADHSTPIFPFNFSPPRSLHQETSDIRSPAFPFSLTPDASTPGFSGFGFDMDKAQDEGTSFAFTGSFFNEKRDTEPTSPSCQGFLFDQSQQSEDFKFSFTSKSLEATDKDNTRDGFPFSFNF